MKYRSIVLQTEPAFRDNFYKFSKRFNMKPMRLILILMKHFYEGKIDAAPIIEEYKEFKSNERNDKIKRLLRNRVSGDKAYEVFREKRDKDESALKLI